MVILSDLSEVIIHGLYGTQDIVAERYGKECGARFWRRHLATEQRFAQLLRGSYSESHYWSEFLRQGTWPFDVDEVKSIFSENMARKIPGTLELYRRINAYPANTVHCDRIIEGAPEFYIVSDHISTRIDELKRMHPDVFALSHRHIWSCYYGMLKKDPGFFPELLDRTGLDPREILFIDDSAANILEAQRYGIASIRFSDADRLEELLASYGFGFAPIAP